MIKLLTFCLFVSLSIEQASINVIQTDMTQLMIDFALGETLVLFTQESSPTIIGKKLVDLMNNKFGNGWISITGTNTTVNGIHLMKNTTILMAHKDVHIFLGKIQTSPSETKLNFSELLVHARNQPVKKIEIRNNNNLIPIEKIENITITTINLNFVGCNETATPGNGSCFEDLSSLLKDKISNTVYLPSLVCVGQRNSYNLIETDDFANKTQFDEFFFSIGDLLFDIYLFKFK